MRLCAISVVFGLCVRARVHLCVVVTTNINYHFALSPTSLIVVSSAQPQAPTCNHHDSRPCYVPRASSSTSSVQLAPHRTRHGEPPHGVASHGTVRAWRDSRLGSARSASAITRHLSSQLSPSAPLQVSCTAALGLPGRRHLQNHNNCQPTDRPFTASHRRIRQRTTANSRRLIAPPS